MQYHQGQSTLPRLAVLLRSMGVSISKRQLQRLLTENHVAFLAEARDVLRAGLETSPWVSVDDTGARHAGKNGYCTQMPATTIARLLNAVRPSRSRCASHAV